MKRINLGLLSLFMLVLISCSSSSEEVIINLNERIHHDDFEYSVSAYTTAKQIGNDSSGVKADGNFYLVKFVVENNTKRVNHAWNNTVGYIIDEDGRIYENNEIAQKALNLVSPFEWEQDYVTPFQSTDSTVLVFDLPTTVKTPYLKVRGETLMGDFLDGNRFEKTKIKLF
jgi:hypothetical protein